MLLLLTTTLFTSQLVHLYWMTTHVAFLRLFGESFFNPSHGLELALIFVDYLEIPALIGATLLYVRDIIKNGLTFKSLLFLFLINSQYLHIFWITDELIIGGVLPIWLSWIAISIDYLELPVIIDTNIKTFRLIKQKFS